MASDMSLASFSVVTRPPFFSISRSAAAAARYHFPLNHFPLNHKYRLRMFQKEVSASLNNNIITSFPKQKRNYGVRRYSGFHFFSRRFLHAISSAHLKEEDDNSLEPSVPEVSDAKIELNLKPTSNLSSGLITGLSAVGFLETAYLTWTKLAGGSVLCPAGGDSCKSVLDSDYAMFFGFPLPLAGMLMYGVVALLAWSMRENHSTIPIEQGSKRWLLLGSTTAMATASAYLMYILQVKLGGAFCAYCVASALLSFSLLLLTLRVFTTEDLQKVAGLQLATVATVVIMFSAAFENSTSALAGSADINLLPVEPEVTTVSNSVQISLAKHLSAIGAKMYGAFWCSHCHEQKEVISGEQDLQELARISGFDLSKPSN
ncbi:hypothetical protein O6H91_21G032800 [Diphasiastrum complanatum]|uniref:Uncharacterized protein n=2 Tax=Diphasiastrum complanatum TaxID=34168 RepID=A0ACC2AL19_DIPCM|nr:hypothetical protein O6H91_21G032800 [Diphasiastrum complanatum]KAJ7517645.1 hypothetical protein O6H91_21G032800 [Diphasiastrum complanatum]